MNYRELSKDIPNRGMIYYLCCCCMKYPQALVTVHLDRATGLEKQDLMGVGEWILIFNLHQDS